MTELCRMVQMLSLPPHAWRWSRQAARQHSSFPSWEGSGLQGSFPGKCRSQVLDRGDMVRSALGSCIAVSLKWEESNGDQLSYLLYSLGCGFLKGSSACFLRDICLGSPTHMSNVNRGCPKFWVENCASVHELALHKPCCSQRYRGADMYQAVWHPGHPALTFHTAVTLSECLRSKVMQK